jgi:hypothetical protein
MDDVLELDDDQEEEDHEEHGAVRPGLRRKAILGRMAPTRPERRFPDRPPAPPRPAE